MKFLRKIIRKLPGLNRRKKIRRTNVHEKGRHVKGQTFVVTREEYAQMNNPGIVRDVRGDKFYIHDKRANKGRRATDNK